MLFSLPFPIPSQGLSLSLCQTLKIIKTEGVGLLLQWETLGAVGLFPRISSEADLHFRA